MSGQASVNTRWIAIASCLPLRDSVRQNKQAHENARNFPLGRIQETEQKPKLINGGNYGEDLAYWIIAEFNKLDGIAADPEPLQEDWGWRVCVSSDQFSGHIGLGSYEVGTSNGDQDGWMCFWDKPRKKNPILFFGKAKVEECNTRIEEASKKILLRFHDIISASPRFSQIRWHNEADLMKGNEDSWTSTPH